MRVSLTIGALTLMACALAPSTGRAATPPDLGAAPEAEAGVGSGTTGPGCRCPGVHYRHVWRKHRHGRVHARRRAIAIPVTNIPPPVYDPPIPAPWDTAYDRAMTLHFRSPEVSGTWTDEPGFPHTPPIHGVQHYRVQAGAAVLQYDGLIGQYVPLALADARRAFPPVAAAVPAAAAPAAR